MAPQLPDDLYDRYEAIFEGIEPPFAFVDLDALEENSKEMLGRASGKPIRVASKSIRCREVIDRVAAAEGYEGILAYALPEALMLARSGHRDIVVAYPTADRHAISGLAEMTGADPELKITLIVDETRQLDLIEGAVGSGATPIRVAIDIDVGYSALRGQVRIGPKRSPIRTPAQARKLAEEIASRPGLRLDGVLAYEGQVAGVGDAAPGKALKNLAIRKMQAASMEELRERRAAIVAAVEAVGPLRFVNGGGTGSLELTTKESAVTELAAGSGFFAPALFDSYSRFTLTPAAGFALPIVRRPDTAIATALGGGYIASGPAGADRLPSPWLPAGLRLDKLEGAGEVQTPLLGEAAVRLKVGNRVYMRHAKAGELCEHFNVLHLVEGDAIVSEAPTYRGEGYVFV
ncbi:MAG: amino acid deaminase/aldolase [Solirubrobacterales bacterium]